MSKRRKKKVAKAATPRNDSGHRLDGWSNLATGLGYARDKRTWGSYTDLVILDDSALENLYAGDDLAAIIVDSLPEQALGDGYELVYDGDDHDVMELRRMIEQKAQELDVETKVTDALCWGRLYGGGAVLLGADDKVEDAEIPLDDSKVEEVRFLNDLERQDLNPIDWYDEPREPNYGQPSVYALTPRSTSRSGGALVAAVHETRMVMTSGARTPRRTKQLNRGWSLSVLQRVHEVLRDFEQAFGAAGNMLLDCSQGVLSVSGLIRSIGNLGAGTIEGRMSLIDLYRASNRMLVLDKEGEDFKYVERTFTGVDSVLSLFMLRMAAAARMPVTTLFGRSPAGLNATGESDLENWYSAVRSYRRHDVKPILERIIRLIAISLGSEDPNAWSIEFPSLWTERPKDNTERSKIAADRDVAYINAGVYTAAEVALARVHGIDAPIVIDEDKRKEEVENPTVPATPPE